MLQRIKAMLQYKCPKCEKGNLFVNNNFFVAKNILQMHDKCQQCGQATSLEPGFYWGAAYVSYGLTVLLIMLNFMVYYIFVDINTIQQVIWFLVLNVIVTIACIPVIVRLSRVFYLYIFVAKHKGQRF